MQILSREFKADMAFKCYLCKKTFMNNIDFMRHLSLHAYSDQAAAADLADLHQCKYSFRPFDDQMSMEAHIEENYLKSGHPFIDRISNTTFKVRDDV